MSEPEYEVVEQVPFVAYRAKYTRHPEKTDIPETGWVYLNWRNSEMGGWSLSKSIRRYSNGIDEPKNVRKAFKSAGPWWYQVDLDSIEVCRGAKQTHQTPWSAFEGGTDEI